MKYYRYILIGFFVVLTTSSFARVYIYGRFSGKIENNKIICYEPFRNGAINMFYNPKNIEIHKDMSFSIRSDFFGEGMFILNINSVWVKIYVNRNDTIFIKVFASRQNNAINKIDSIKFDKNNKNGNSIYNNLFWKLNNQNFIIENVFLKKQFDSPHQLFLQSKIFIDSILRPLDSLKASNLISNRFFAISKLDLEASYLNSLFIITKALIYYKIKNIRVNNEKISVAIQFNNRVFNNYSYYDSLRINWYKTLNPLDTNLIYSFNGLDYSFHYIDDVFKQTISSNLHYNENFRTLYKDQKRLGFLQGVLLETIWQNVLYASSFVDEDIDSVNVGFNLFKKKFPKSPYMSFLQSRFKNVSSNHKSETQNVDSIMFLNMPRDLTLNELFKHFEGKWIFIDLWATWCVPCLQEFGFEKKLLQLLQAKDITPLYISLDNDSENDHWKSLVRSKTLVGYHLRASKELSENLKKNIYNDSDFTDIPRYILVNPHGTIVDTNLPRPSNINNLKLVLDTLLKN